MKNFRPFIALFLVSAVLFCCNKSTRETKSISFSKSQFTESTLNDGSFSYSEIEDTLLLGAVNFSFQGALGEDFLETGKLIYRLDEHEDLNKNLDGLTIITTLVYEDDRCRTKYSAECDQKRGTFDNEYDYDRDGEEKDLSLALIILGKKTEHEAVDGTRNLELEFKDGAIKGDEANDIVNYKRKISLIFRDRASIQFSTSSITKGNNRRFIVSSGLADNGLTAQLVNDYFAPVTGTDMIAKGHVTVDGTLPTGLTLRSELTSSNRVEFYLDGVTTDAPGSTVFKVTFNNSAFNSKNSGSVTSSTTELSIVIR